MKASNYFMNIVSNDKWMIEVRPYQWLLTFSDVKMDSIPTTNEPLVSSLFTS